MSRSVGGAVRVLGLCVYWRLMLDLLTAQVYIPTCVHLYVCVCVWTWVCVSLCVRGAALRGTHTAVEGRSPCLRNKNELVLALLLTFHRKGK